MINLSGENIVLVGRCCFSWRCWPVRWPIVSGGAGVAAFPRGGHVVRTGFHLLPFGRYHPVHRHDVAVRHSVHRRHGHLLPGDPADHRAGCRAGHGGRGDDGPRPGGLRMAHRAVAGLEMPFALALLLASTMSSTDSASVFSILRSKKQGLKEHLRPLLELESGSNDPMAYMLTILLIGVLSNTSEHVGLGMSVVAFVVQMVVGALSGYLVRTAGRVDDQPHRTGEPLALRRAAAGLRLLFVRLHGSGGRQRLPGRLSLGTGHRQSQTGAETAPDGLFSTVSRGSCRS